jgi:hypothetical protein
MRLPGDIIERTNLSGCKVVVCDLDGIEKVKAGGLTDISPGDMVAVYSRYVVNRTLVVYK